MQDQTPEWAVGQRVIIVTSARNIVMPVTVRPIERITPTQLVVDGKRFRKDRLEINGGGTWAWDVYTVKLVRMDAPEAPKLLAQRAERKAWLQLDAAINRLRTGPTPDKAELVALAASEWAEASKNYAAKIGAWSDGR